jgi:hypothetical protein
MEQSKETGDQRDQMEEFHGCPVLQKELQEINQSVGQYDLNFYMIVN